MCLIDVDNRIRPICAPAPATVTVEVTTFGGPVVGITFGTSVLAYATVAEVGASGSVTTSIDQFARLPPSPVVWSAMVRSQTPFGFSPMNAPSASSGDRSVFGTRFV